MADEAYRAVFLRVHPTGKMVLSLTTESDGKEAQYAQLVADELGVPRARRQGRPRRHRPVRRRSRLQHEPVRGHRGGGRQRRREDPREGAAARRHGARRAARDARVVERRLGRGGRGDPDAGQDDRGRSRSTRTAPARCRPGSRAGSTRRRSTATDQLGRQAGVERDLDLVGDLQRAEQRRVRLDAPVGLPDDGATAEPAVIADGHVEGERARCADERELALHVERLPSPSARTAVERNAMSCRFRTSSSIVCSMFALSSSPSACMPPVPSRTRSDVASASSTSERRAVRRPRASPARR